MQMTKGKHNPTDTRQRIIDAAFQLFTDHGIEGTSTRQIATLAGVNEVTLFRHFGTKDGLAREVVSCSFPSDALPRLQKVEFGEDLESELYQLTMTIIRLHSERQDFFRFIFANIVSYPEHRDFFINMQQPMLDFLTESLAPECQQSGLDPMVVALEFIAPIVMRSIRRYFLDHVLIEDEEFARTHARMMAAAIRHLQECSP